ncbi:BspA family leucine-rich repeat surface protein [Chryseobacterium oranimense]|uniref:BspA family leucine-rich repeat surface protein n=1 Tax=Chryseobacterium oranimense TaxID=421058 RepID=UPI0021AFA522|nr:BspA family leucine-rich repeat surface protein [Chryseobacterium oranimense]UWX59016.1 BspA family leucine-rich repeat surface protein [Chryseobacterium oranimense]
MRVLLVFFLVIGGLFSAQPIITKWNTNINFDNSKAIVIPTEGTYNYTYQGITNPSLTGSGTGASGNTTIVFPAVGLYTVTITPTSPFKFYFNGVSMNNAKKLLDIIQWGNAAWKSDLSDSFHGCQNMVISATDTPNFSNVTNMYLMFFACKSLVNVPSMTTWDTGNVTDMSYMFYNAENFNQNIANWNTSNVTTMNSMFYNATNFNQNIGAWNTGNVTDMSKMFQHAHSFNGNIGSWNTSSVTDMSYMFVDAIAFNSYIGNWNTGNVTTMSVMFSSAENFNQNIGNWNTSSVTNMGNMFQYAQHFNQNIGNWNTSNVIEMEAMFYYAPSFNQNLGNWTLNPTVDLGAMFINSGLNCENYSKTLKGWATNPATPNGRHLGDVTLSYGVEALQYRNILVNTKNWTISTDTYDPSCMVSLATDDMTAIKSPVKLYPNPASEKVFINSGKKINSIILLNSANQILAKLQETEIDLSKYPSGVYFVTIYFENGTFNTQKVIKK